MPNYQGTIKKIWPNSGKPRIVMDNELSVSMFKQEQLGSAKEGDTVSFSYKTVEKAGKQYNNIDGVVAIVSGGSISAPTNTGSSPSAPRGFERNGAQVGAAINQAITAMPLFGDEPSMDNIEHLAKGFLLMGDRLLAYKE